MLYEILFTYQHWVPKSKQILYEILFTYQHRVAVKTDFIRDTLHVPTQSIQVKTDFIRDTLHVPTQSSRQNRFYTIYSSRTNTEYPSKQIWYEILFTYQHRVPKSKQILYEILFTYMYSYQHRVPVKTDFRVRRVWRYQRSNQNPQIEEGQTILWPKIKGEKDKQRSTLQNITHRTKDRVTRNQLNIGELRCSGRVSISCSTRMNVSYSGKACKFCHCRKWSALLWMPWLYTLPGGNFPYILLHLIVFLHNFIFYSGQLFIGIN